ncbi:MAG: alpha/beta hydrolase [Candidatus Lokiarchaeota archaeon]|nr:alpha/beta hydrolase [Candidatus Lokiarchaeota archaeon]
MFFIYFIADDGAQLYYEVHGPENGKPIFFLHGWGISSALFSEQVTPLKELGYKIILMDSRRHGKSDMDKRCIEIYKDNLLDLMYSDFKALRKFLNINGKYMLLGHSAGGAISALIATFEPQNVEALVMLTSSYTISENPAILIIWEMVPLFVQAIYNKYFRSGYKLVLRSRPVIYTLAMSLDQPIDKIRSWIEDFLVIPREQLLLEHKNFLRHNIKDKLKNIKCPTLIIAGALDLVTPKIMSKTMHELIHNSELHVIQNAGHLAMIEKKDEVNNILVNFVKKNYANISKK